MTKKKIIYGTEARDALKRGINQLADAVAPTLGPKGRNVAIERDWGTPLIIDDGVTVVKEFALEDPFENMGADIMKEAASKTSDAAGDGTTTSTLLARALINNGLQAIANGGDPVSLKEELQQGVVLVVEQIKKLATLITEKDILRVATISAKNEAIGELIAKAIALVGKDGVITVEEGNGTTLELEHKSGMELDKGFMSPYFATDTEKMVAELKNPLILLTDSTISKMDELLPVMEIAGKNARSLLIIAEEITGDALAGLIVNKMRGRLESLAVKAPAFGDRKLAFLEDLGILTGANVISQTTGRKLDGVTLEDLGEAEKVWADKEQTKIIGANGDTDVRVAQIKAQIKETDSDFDREKLKERLGKLTNGVAVIHVGASTEVEMRDLKERVNDAVGASRAALEEGVVAGGGVTLLRARQVLKAGILYKSLSEPMRAIFENAGLDAGYILTTIENSEEPNYGYDVVKKEFGDMLKAGIVDPAKVTRSALENAVSVAIMALTTEALMVNIKDNEEK